jgi:hypothetical protein
MDILHLRGLEREGNSIGSIDTHEREENVSDEEEEEIDDVIEDVDDYSNWKVLSWLSHLAMHE